MRYCQSFIIFTVLKLNLLSLFILFVTLLYSVAAFASTDSVTTRRHPMAYSGFQGGMMVNVGYGFSGRYALYDADGQMLEQLSPAGVPVGMGGALRVNFGKHLRVGGAGYVSTMNYGGNGSYSRIGWGGVLADSKWDIDRWTLFVGGMFGGGTARHLNIINDEHDEFQVARSSFREYPFLAFDPFFGAEYAMTHKIHLVFQVDYIVNITARRDDFVQGPRFFLGFMFCH